MIRVKLKTLPDGYNQESEFNPEYLGLYEQNQPAAIMQKHYESGQSNRHGES
jgi:hypothetical protein